jgi:hypothetical protein
MRRLPPLIVALSLLATGACRPDPPQPPDPDEPQVEVTCDSEQSPLTLDRLQADSRLDTPPWLEVCALCPPSAIELTAAVDGEDVPLEVAWAQELSCAVATSPEPLPDGDLLDLHVLLVDGERSGEADLEVPLGADRSSNPIDLGTATWRIDFEFDDLREPWFAWETIEFFEDPVDMLLSLGEPDADGARPVTVAPTVADGGAQDPCHPTSTWLAPAWMDRRQIGGALSAGDELFSISGGPVRRGAWQASVTEGGELLLDGAFLALIDVSRLEEQSDLSPAVICDFYAALTGGQACVPCDDPAEGTAGLPLCVPMLWEFAQASLEPIALESIAPDELPQECFEE